MQSAARLAAFATKNRREVSASRRKVAECHGCFKEQREHRPPNSQAPSINPGQQMHDY
jgi:hypothetical protein